MKLYSEKQVMQEPVIKVNEKGMQLDSVYRMFETAVSTVFTEKKRLFELSVSKLDGLSPLSTLKRGFSVAKNQAGKVVKKVADTRAGEDISVVVTDGEIKAVVK